MTNRLIVYISSYTHLSIPQYQQVLPHLSNYENLYFDVKDPVTLAYGVNRVSSKSLLVEIFDEYLEIDAIPVKKRQRSFNLIHFVKNLIQIRKYRKTIFSTLNELKPCAIISCSDNSLSDRISIEWCLKKMIPFIIIQPSFLGGFKEYRIPIIDKLKYFVFNQILRVPLVSKTYNFGEVNYKTHLILWHEAFASNPTRPNLYFTGNPQLDSLFKKQSTEIRKNGNIIICTQGIDEIWGMDRFMEIIEIYKQAITSNPNHHFYIKVHPREIISKYMLLIPSSDFPNVTITQDMDLSALFEISDLQISVLSYTTIQAAAMGLPVVMINPNWLDIELKDYIGVPLGIIVSEKHEIKKAIEQGLDPAYLQDYHQKRINFFNDNYFSSDGKSSNRAATMINRIIEMNTT
ncbi:MAG: hypothetical protein HeimC2_18180 [Candidatus Heimdallarchaeota archaeon LC_2]|nr:MAG: hypothetical protein HeimC2_18180 [Candidatus Heimdallarchaeota archaeon LC_2]